MKQLKDVSRDAQVVAYCLFLMGRPTQVTFNRPHIIHPRTRAALDELASAGLLEVMDTSKLPRGAMGWQAVKGLRPMLDFKEQGIPAITKDESFPVTTE